MRVMPANATGWFWHCLARETGMLGHLFSPGAQRGPWPWFPYALDCGSFACWDMATNTFSDAKWETTEREWLRLLAWAGTHTQAPLWAVVPDVPGNWTRTLERWERYRPELGGIPAAIAVQDGATPEQVRELAPDVVCVGGSTEWKWATWKMWAREFPRVHVLRVNRPHLLDQLRDAGVESVDGTGWNRGDRKQTAGLERWLRSVSGASSEELWRYTCRGALRNGQGDILAATGVEL